MARSVTGRFERETDEFGRGVSFLDALFAFALTLLVTTLDVPPDDAWASLDALRHALGAPLIAFALSFAVIAAFWRAHHQLLQRFAALDDRLITLNLVLAAAVVLLPFTTESLGATQDTGYVLPVVLYAANVGLASLVLTVIALHGLRAELLHERTDRALLRATALAGLVRPLVFLGSIPVALVAGPLPGQLTWIALLPLGVLADRLVRRRTGRA